MKILDVPLVIQKKRSVDCGLASAQMILEYWKQPLSFEEIQKYLKVDKFGVCCPQLGSFLVKQGFDVTLMHFNPGLFTLGDIGKTEKEIKIHLQDLFKKKRKKAHKKIIGYFLQFLKDGGKMEVKIPSVEDIRKELEAGHPPIVVLTSNFLSASVPWFNFHFNVITGIDDKYIYVNDPLWDERGGKHKYKISDFLFGVYSSSAGGLDNPSLLKIRKKR